MRGTRASLLLLSACALLTLLGACASSSHTAKGTPTFTDPKQAISVRVGQQFHVELAATPGTGYSWRVGQTQPELVVQTGARYVPPSTTRVGAAGRQVFDFRATRKGEGALALLSVGPGTNAPVGKSDEFRITVH